MINKNAILKLVKDVNRRSLGQSDRRLIRPRREWAIGLCLFVALVVIGGVYNIYQYSRFDNLKNNLTTANTNQTHLDETSIKQALELYRRRGERFTSLQMEAAALPEVASSTDTAANPAAATTSEETVSTDPEPAGTIAPR